MFSNIRRCRLTLRLQTQVGWCIMNKVGELDGVGAAWFFPKGVANMLSQFRMVVHGKWKMTCNTES